MRLNHIWRQLRRDPFMMVVVVIALSLLIASFAIPLISHADPNRQFLLDRLLPPTWRPGFYALGTDSLGRPMWIRLVYGLRTSYMVGLLAVAMGVTIGVVAGLVAGYAGGWVDDLIMRAVEVQLALPGLLLAIAILALLRGGIVALVIILGLDNWMFYARVTRAQVMTMKEGDFILAVRSLGASPGRIVFRHLLPNTIPAIVAIATLELAHVMLAEAALSFLGFGVQAPTVSLGLILSEGRDYLITQWWIATLSGGLLLLAVLGTNLVGNWLQRVSEPTTA
jgi:peptide/nickel transport system permease protein